MSKRKTVSKGLRFDIFRRDGFTCQYCGRHPDDVVLEIDHIRPVIDGGDNDPLNLITACEDCNRGKGKKRLDTPQRPDADLAWLEARQEIAELVRYQETKKERDELLDDIVVDISNHAYMIADMSWAPSEVELMKMLSQYAPEEVEAAIMNVAIKVGGGYIPRGGTGWIKYTWAILRNRARE
jgi:hypothetical protein